MSPLAPETLQNASVLELGYGNGSLLVHVADCAPARLAGVELGDTEIVARRNLEGTGVEAALIKGDLCEVDAGRFDVVYCIGVLHHLKEPERGFASILRHTRDGGHFHAWVYGREGNGVIIALVEPLRRIASRLPWWFTKYAIAAPAVLPYYMWAKVSEWAAAAWPGLRGLLSRLPLYDYTRWIAAREFWFFHHVAFDQLVTPQTRYFSEAEVRGLLADPLIEPGSTYVIQRNGNSWKFGGRRKEQPPR
jgi:SAM-dependent methyltransferase